MYFPLENEPPIGQNSTKCISRHINGSIKRLPRHLPIKSWSVGPKNEMKYMYFGPEIGLCALLYKMVVHKGSDFCHKNHRKFASTLGQRPRKFSPILGRRQANLHPPLAEDQANLHHPWPKAKQSWSGRVPKWSGRVPNDLVGSSIGMLRSPYGLVGSPNGLVPSPMVW